MKTFSYDKNEKLKSRKQLQEIFTTGKTFSIFPVKIFFQFIDEQDTIVKAGVGVSKKYFKKAVDRNYIKRLLRETYRTEKIPLHEQLTASKKKFKIFFLFVDGNLPEHILIRQKMKIIIDKLCTEVKNSNDTVS